MNNFKKPVLALAIVSLFILYLCYGNYGSSESQITRYSIRGPKPGTPDWLDIRYPGNCLPRENVTFLKTHKCASSAIQNILFRYGEKNERLFALPSGNYFGGGTRYLQSDMLKAEMQNTLGFNIYAIHSKWDLKKMRKMMPPGTMFITIVREPSELFQSLYSYTQMEKMFGSMKSYIQNIDANGARKGGYVGYNQMAWDMGLPAGQFHNDTAIIELIADADDLFDLVMVAERMEESLMMLKLLLCADYEDMVVLKVNARKKEVVENGKLDDITLQTLKYRLGPDYLIYNHFVKKFENLVKIYGKYYIVEDIKEYTRIFDDSQRKCKFSKVPGESIENFQDPHKKLVSGYIGNTADPECASLIRPELKYLDRLRRKQLMTVSNALRKKGSIGGRFISPPGSVMLERHRNDKERMKDLLRQLNNRP